MTFTPGPWKARKQLGQRGQILGWIIESVRGDRIGWSDFADVVTNLGDTEPYEQSGANAQLMAEAPDMYALIKGLIDNPYCGEEGDCRFCGMESCNDDDPEAHAPDCLYIKARIVIAQTEGEATP
jgi:hypothetical protein